MLWPLVWRWYVAMAFSGVGMGDFGGGGSFGEVTQALDSQQVSSYYDPP